MGYDVFLYRTKDKEIKVEEKTIIDEYMTKNDGIRRYSDIRRVIKAKEVLWLHKAYWLGNIIEEIGTPTEYFIYLTKNDMKHILKLSRECAKYQHSWLVNKYFHTGCLTSYEDMVIWEQFKYFNRCMSQLLRNKTDVHYWYLKP